MGEGVKVGPAAASCEAPAFWRCSDCGETFASRGEPEACANCNAERSWLVEEDESGTEIPD